MGATGRPLVFPTIADIVAVNREHIRRTTGLWRAPDNLLNRGSLEWVLDAIQHPLFGQDTYPGVIKKASLLGWTIIARHVFVDANKRTGMSMLLGFSLINGLKIDVTSSMIIETALLIAQHNETGFSAEDLEKWATTHTA